MARQEVMSKPQVLLAPVIGINKVNIQLPMLLSVWNVITGHSSAREFLLCLQINSYILETTILQLVTVRP